MSNIFSNCKLPYSYSHIHALFLSFSFHCLHTCKQKTNYKKGQTKVMQQLTQFEQKSQVSQLVHLLQDITNFDDTLLHFFINQHIPDPKHLFIKIIQQPIPHRKAQQQQTLIMLTYTFYRLEQIPMIQNEKQMLRQCYQQYLTVSPFMPSVVKYHQMVRQWRGNIAKTEDLVTAKKDLSGLLAELQKRKEQKLQILIFRLQMCQIVLQVALQKSPLQRSKIIKFIKSYHHLKQQNKVSIETTVHTFCYLISQLLVISNDLYVFFEMEIKQLKKQPLPEEEFLLIQHTLHKCQEFSTNKIVSAVQTFVRKNIPNEKSRIKRKKIYPTVYHNQETNDDIFRKVDHFLKFRPAVTLRARSQESRTNRPSIERSPRITGCMSTQFSLHETTRLGWFKSAQKKWKVQSGMSLNKSGTFTKRKRRDLYRTIMKDKETDGVALGRVNLQDEMKEIGPIEEERCRLTLEDILFGEISNNPVNDNVESDKMVGAPEDKQFGSVTLTFFTIFNQQMAQLQLLITKKGKQYLFECQITSTYCRDSTKLRTDKKGSITLQYFQHYLEASVIYYEAIQEGVERKASIKQLYILEEMLREKLNKEMSHNQLQKLLFAVDLAKSQFFWYYTKSSLINGSRIEKRNNITLEDESAFAVCLSKFKSDYDSCLEEIIQVQNMTSLIEACLYLSQGRIVVYRQFRKISGLLLLQVITISKEVYKSVKRRGKVPYFENTELERTFYDLQKGKIRNMGANKIDARNFLQQQQIFVVFMKNIVQNFIEVKYVHKFRQYLQQYYELQNKSFFEEKHIYFQQDYHLECHQNDQIYENTQTKPILPQEITNLRDAILAYTEVYQLKQSFHISSQKHHLLKIQKKTFFVEEIVLRNNLKVIKYYKSKSKITYSILLYHKNPSNLTYLSTAFHNRLAFVHSNKYFINLVRHSLPQQQMANDSPCNHKIVLKFKNTYCYASVGQSQCLLFWRLDMYFPQTQIHLSTFLDEQLIYECIGHYGTTGKRMWHQSLLESKIDLDKMEITILHKTMKLFQVLKQILVNQGKQQLFKVQLIQLDHQLHYLILHYNTGELSYGRFDDIPFAYVSQLLSPNANKRKPSIYCNLIIRLSHQFRAGLAASQPLTSQFFIQN